jgi:TPR repeat protein
VAKGVEASIHWFTLVVEQGSLDAMAALATTHLYGAGVPRPGLGTCLACSPMPLAQSHCGVITAQRGNLVELLQWFTLAAA